MKVTKITKTWGSKGRGASVSIWMPAQTFGSLEMLAGGRAILEIHATMHEGLKDIVRYSFGADAMNRNKEFTVTLETYDDETGERVE